MRETTRDIQQTFFIPMSGLDAVNYLMLGSEIKVATQEVVPAVHLHFLDDFRDLIRLYRQTYSIVITNDGSARKSVGRELIQRMDEFLQQLESAGLRLCFRMWSLPFVDHAPDVGIDEEPHDASVDWNQHEPVVEDAGTAIETTARSIPRFRFGCGAIVGFMIVPQSLPLMIPDAGNSHAVICISQLPDWNSLSDLLAE